MVSRLRLQVFVAAVGLVAIGFALAYFLLVIKSQTQPAPGGTYVEGVVIDNAAQIVINPLVAIPNSFSSDLASLVFSGLTRSVPSENPNEPGQIVEPDLADRWFHSADGKEWDFHLRSNVRWQDGMPITARDVVYTISLLKSDDYPGGRDLATLWRGVTVYRMGDYTVRFRLDQPWPAFLNYTTLGLLPAHKLDGKLKAADLARTEFNTAPVGSGPYQLAPGGLAVDGVTLITNPLYHRAKPYLDKIWFRFYPSPSAALSALESDQIDGVSQVTADEINRIAALKNVTEISTPRARNTFMFLNLQRSSLFGQKEVRQAFAYAINKTDLVDKALYKQAQISLSPILASSWAYKSDIMSYTYNVTQAKQLLEKAGWITNRDGIRERNEQPLFFKILIDDTPDKRAVASYIVDNLKKIDVIAQIDAAPSPRDFDNAIKNNNYDAIIFTIQGALNDPDQYVNWHSSYAEPGDNHYNFANWRLNRADQFLEASRNVVSQEERRKLYLEWQTIWADEMPSIPLYSSTYNYVVSNRVGGVQGQNLKVVNVTSDRLKDISSRYIFTSTRFGS